MKYYTPHGIEHCKAVEDNLHRLIPKELHKEFSESEKFFMLISAWTHDIGMLRGIQADDDNIKDSVIRDLHHIRSERYIASNYIAIDIKEEEATACGLLARFHRRRCNIEECPEFLTISKHGRIRLRLIAAYLRLADALHVDQSRTPSDQYAISLTYNIPYASKLHWYKSKFVNGIDIDADGKVIIVELKSPQVESGKSGNKKENIMYDKIYNEILNDLNEEVDSVKNVLFEGGITYFLYVKKKIIHVQTDERFRKDIEPVLHYHHLLDNPSSSALLMLVLNAIESIIFSAEENEITISDNKQNNGNIRLSNIVREKIEAFLKEIREDVIPTRRCHSAFLNLIIDIDKHAKAGDLCSWIKERKEKIKENKGLVRINSMKYLSGYIDKKEYLSKILECKLYSLLKKKGLFREGKNKYSCDFDCKINIILYGYSSLAMETIFGFRDAAMRKMIELCNKYRDMFQNDKHAEYVLFQNENISELKKATSECFRIFCCEGQPKNHTAWTGRYHHHDGSLYALEFAKKGFQEIYIIPDAAASSLISRDSSEVNVFPIHFIIVGTNGFDKDVVRHSSGHSMMIALSCLARKLSELKNSDDCEYPKVVLSLTTDKFGNDSKKEEIKKENRIAVNNGGWFFRQSFSGEQIRSYPFFTQDHDLQKQLEMYKDVINFYNPREDEINISMVDIAISEKSFLIKNTEKDKWNGEYISKTDKSSIFDVKNITS